MSISLENLDNSILEIFRVPYSTDSMKETEVLEPIIESKFIPDYITGQPVRISPEEGGSRLNGNGGEVKLPASQEFNEWAVFHLGIQKESWNQGSTMTLKLPSY